MKLSKTKLDIVIPTLNRERKLLNCIRSIEKAKKDHNITVFIYFSNKMELLHISSLVKQEWIKLDIVTHYKVPEFWNTHLKYMKADIMAYLNDDVLLLPNSLDNIINHYQEYFPDYDGILGLNQSNIESPTNKEGAFGIIGNKYANRFPDRQVFCPDYYRFYADAEVELFAKSIGKFKYNKEVKIHHLHGSFYGEDETHIAVRKYLKQDKRIFIKRQEKDLLWGYNFKLLFQGGN